MLRFSCVLFALLLLTAMSAYAVKDFKTSNYGNGHQIWFEAEAFDKRDSANIYQLRKAEAGLDNEPGVFGDSITNGPGTDGGWLLYEFDISKAGGRGGKWHFWGRLINPSDHSDWLWVLGDPGDDDKIPASKPTFTDDDRIFEADTAETWNWDGPTSGLVGRLGTEGHIKTLRNGQNTMMIWWRQSSNIVQWDVFMWADKADYKPTDDDYINASPFSVAYLADKLSSTWGEIKSSY